MYELYAEDMYRYGYNLVRNKQLVEDCLHELFLHLHSHRRRLGSTDNIRFYLYLSLRRRLFDTVRKSNRYRSDEYVFEDAEFLIQPYEQQWIHEQSVAWQNKVVVTELNKLPKRQKEILYLVYMKGLTYQQAAEVMDITLKSVYNTVSVALATLKGYLKESLQPEGLTWGIVGLFLKYILHG